jgi:NADH-quinone oxidoreductase subunit N
MNYASLFMNLFGEIVLTAAAFLVLVADVMLYRKQKPAERNHRLARWTLAGLGTAAVVYFIQLGSAPVNFADGMLVINPLNLFFKEVVLVITAITVFFSMEEPISEHVGEYYAMVLFGAIGMVFLVTSENLLMIFVSLELLSLCLYALVGFQKRILRSAEGAMKYFVFGAVSSGFLLFGLSYIYGATNALSLSAIAGSFKTDPLMAQSPVLLLGILFTLVGFGFKIAVVPFHLWAPDAYEGAAAPVAGFVASGSKVASFVALTKFLFQGVAPAAGSATIAFPFTLHFTPGWAPVIALMAFVSMIWGNVAAITQTNLKRLLAYSSVAHAGYLLVALLGAHSWGETAVYFYIIVYALTNLGAFGVVTALADKVGGDDIACFRGVWKRAPGQTVLMMIFMLSLAGIPPLAGFFGKFYLFAAGLSGDQTKLGYLWLVATAILMSAVSFYYYLQVLKVFYVADADARRGGPISVCPCQTWPMTVIALLIFAIGWYPTALLDWIQGFLKG